MNILKDRELIYQKAIQNWYVEIYLITHGIIPNIGLQQDTIIFLYVILL